MMVRRTVIVCGPVPVQAVLCAVLSCLVFHWLRLLLQRLILQDGDAKKVQLCITIQTFNQHSMLSCCE